VIDKRAVPPLAREGWTWGATDTVDSDTRMVAFEVSGEVPLTRLTVTRVWLPCQQATLRTLWFVTS
jgi:hypothetical protein